MLLRSYLTLRALTPWGRSLRQDLGSGPYVRPLGKVSTQGKLAEADYYFFFFVDDFFLVLVSFIGADFLAVIVLFDFAVVELVEVFVVLAVPVAAFAAPMPAMVTTAAPRTTAWTLVILFIWYPNQLPA